VGAPDLARITFINPAMLLKAAYPHHRVEQLSWHIVALPLQYNHGSLDLKLRGPLRK
jgi:hypothetical protein